MSRRAAERLAVAVLMIVSLAGGARAQTVEELERALAAKDAEIAALKRQLDAARRQSEAAPSPAPAPTPSSPAEASDLDASDRSLERALVREGAVLVPFGAFEVEPNFVYSRIDREGTAFRREAYGPGLELRVGLPWQSQLDVSVPYVIEDRRTILGSNSANGLGDISFALSHQLLAETPNLPNVVASAGYALATGSNTLFTSRTPNALGAGFDSLSASIGATKRADPLVVFGSYTFTHFFPGTEEGFDVDLGESHAVRIGTALAASPTSSLRIAFDTAFFDKTRVAGSTLPDTDIPAASLEVGGAFMLDARTLLDLGVSAGLTRSAPDVRFTVALPMRF
jgi:outer membrane murein-binding lipoprotein Lpp